MGIYLLKQVGQAALQMELPVNNYLQLCAQILV